MQSRVKLTSQCKDCINIPKVANAGKICVEDNKKIQYMFNGIKIYFLHFFVYNKIILG